MIGVFFEPSSKTKLLLH